MDSGTVEKAIEIKGVRPPLHPFAKSAIKFP